MQLFALARKDFSPYIFREFFSFFLCVSLSLSLGDVPKGRVVPNSFRNRKSPGR